jgi:hypothetical protein
MGAKRSYMPTSFFLSNSHHVRQFVFRYLQGGRDHHLERSILAPHVYIPHNQLYSNNMSNYSCCTCIFTCILYIIRLAARKSFQFVQTVFFPKILHLQCSSEGTRIQLQCTSGRHNMAQKDFFRLMCHRKAQSVPQHGTQTFRLKKPASEVAGS